MNYQKTIGDRDVELEGPVIARLTADVSALPGLPGAGGNDFISGLFGLCDGLVGDPPDGAPEVPFRVKHKLTVSEKAVAYVCLLIGCARGETSSEGDLIQAVIAQAIFDLYLVHIRLRPAERSLEIVQDMREAAAYLSGAGLDVHCGLLGVDPDYVRRLLRKLDKALGGAPNPNRRRSNARQAQMPLN